MTPYLLLGVGLVVAMIALQVASAPFGSEDETGFHLEKPMTKKQILMEAIGIIALGFVMLTILVGIML